MSPLHEAWGLGWEDPGDSGWLDGPGAGTYVGDVVQLCGIWAARTLQRLLAEHLPRGGGSASMAAEFGEGAPQGEGLESKRSNRMSQRLVTWHHVHYPPVMDAGLSSRRGESDPASCWGRARSQR